MNNKKKETLTRSDIEKSLNIQFPTLSKSDIRNAVDAIIESITEAVALDERVELRSFGTFSKKFVRPRKFTNPKTKKVSYLGETATMHFKSSKALIDK